MKLIYILFFVGLVHSSIAQIGINTDIPKALFHVDGAGNNTAITRDADDVVITSDGNVGIGTINPTTKMTIKTTGTSTSVVKGFRLRNGTEADKFVLTSDETGVASWEAMVPSKSPVSGHIGLGVNITLQSTIYWQNYFDTGSYIDLGPGKWVLNVLMLLPNAGGVVGKMYFISSTFSDNTTSLVPTDDITSNNKTISGTGFVARHAVLSGSVILQNRTTATKRYYYLGGMVQNLAGIAMTLPLYGGDIWKENNIVAFLLEE